MYTLDLNDPLLMALLIVWAIIALEEKNYL